MKTHERHRQHNWKFSTPLEGWLVTAMAVLLISTIVLFVHKLF